MMRAEMILKSDAVFTGLTEKPFRGGIAIRDNKILAVRPGEQIDEFCDENTVVYDFGNKLIMAGISDSHMHSFVGAATASKYICTDIIESKSEEECVRMLVDFQKKHPDLKRIGGMGWFPVNWEDSTLPTRKSLDAAFPDIPVYLLAADGHTFWLNSKALEESNYTKDRVVTCGEIQKDEKGELTGLLFEIEACTTANEKAFALPKDKIKEVQTDFYKLLSSYGITSISDMSTNPLIEGDFAAYRVAKEIEEEGQIPVRIHLYPSLGIDGDMSRAQALREEYNSDKIRIAGLKQFLDGVTTTYSAALLEPYSDMPKLLGDINYPEKKFIDTVLNANKKGFPVRLHGIGDRAVRLALDIYEKARIQVPQFQLKNSIEHIENIHPDDFSRFEKLGVIASMQPYHVTLDLNEKVERIGKERCKYEWPFKTLEENRAILAFGTDYPVVDFNPFPSIYAAVTRCDDDGNPTGVNPQEKISLASALKAYTYGSACSHNRQNELGTLEEGKLADITVINKNIFEIDPFEIKDCCAIMTIMDGQIVFSKEDN